MNPTIQYRLSLFAGIALSLAAYLINPFGLDAAANKAVAVAVLMITWWIAEALPMPAVALLPLILLPLLNISTMEETTKAYSNPVIFLFMGGFMIGLAIEKWNLHKRIALSIVKQTGTSGNRIILGFIIATSFLSMWLSNTATTMMMFPIALSVIAVMREHEQTGTSLANFSMVLMLVIAYASNIGGMATIIGTPPNVAFVAFIEKKYNYTIQFVDWMLVCTPMVILLLAALYWVLAKWMFPSRISSSKDANRYITEELQKLGRMSTAEKRALSVFLLTALLWIIKDPINQLGFLKLDDSIIAIFGALLLFAIPAGKTENNKPVMLLDWSDTSKMAWGILLLFGGGIALANALEKVGVMAQIGQWLAGFSHINGFALLIIIVVISIFLSEVMSNVAQVIVFAPVLAALADALHLDPLLLGIPMTLAASAASMMPMGTPPNAIVFSSGHIKLKDMIKAGFVMNIVSIILISLFCLYVLPLVMHVIAK
ncbi:sodium-dependent dicarboxylate transporter 2/3/5 [Lacibacter cauensis]|uniref:Sodium-dependent dicarboxylate transporter 2/3/5 n=1 Tax=Lacibacter cauensis TaxID=510947 RepID=A0A562SJA3_9BACT|nr:DASS family sodium-coupled anion symporter [Lacibacter cauensis]TWI81238.1 sodium-dependent dicarboxylate transporter 2/3/5 [Lacibacter cauensis]